MVITFGQMTVKVPTKSENCCFYLFFTGKGLLLKLYVKFRSTRSLIPGRVILENELLFHGESLGVLAIIPPVVNVNVCNHNIEYSV